MSDSQFGVRPGRGTTDAICITILNRDFQLNENMYFDISYADDTTLISAVLEKLQLSTLDLEKACQIWGLKINPLKCAIMTPDSNAEIEIDNNVVPKVSKFKFMCSSVLTAPQRFNTE